MSFADHLRIIEVAESIREHLEIFPTTPYELELMASGYGRTEEETKKAVELLIQSGEIVPAYDKGRKGIAYKAKGSPTPF